MAMACVGAAVVVTRREQRSDAPSSSRTSGSVEGTPGAAEARPRAEDRVPVAEAEPTAAPERTSTLLEWGRGPKRIGKAHGDEGHGETSLRLAVDAQGSAYLLDGANDRVVRLLADGGASDVRLPVKDPLDVAVTKEGGLALLSREGRDGRVTLTDANGRPVGTLALPEDVAGRARSVVVSGNDVYVESRSGEHRRVGDVSGVVDPTPTLVPGAPTRDGKAFVTAILPSPSATEVHVFVLERATRTQRWSRLVRPSVAVEGIVLADTDLAGDVYLIVTGKPRGGNEDRERAELLCLESERGDVVGSVALPVELGPEAIADAKVVDGGGVVFTVATRAGLRVERSDCHAGAMP